MLKIKYEGYNVFVGTENKVILEVWLDRYSSPERSQKYISALALEVENYINGLSEEPEYFSIGSLIKQIFGGNGRREFYYHYNGVRTAVCYLLLDDDKMDDNFIKRILLIMGRYWNGGEF